MKPKIVQKFLLLRPRLKLSKCPETLRYALITSSYKRLPSNGPFSSRFSNNFFYKSHLILPDKIAMIFNDGHKSWILSSSSFLQIPVASSRFATNILHTALLLSPLNLRYSFTNKHRFVYTQNDITRTNNTSIYSPIYWLFITIFPGNSVL